MPPRGRKHWCKLCRKSFPSYSSLGGHMSLHSGKRKQKKLSKTTPSPPNIRDGAGGYGLRERRHSTWLLCDSSDDSEYPTPVPKMECQLCFRVFPSRGSLGMHMRWHTRRKKMAAEKAPRESEGCSGDNVPVPTPVILAYGMEVVNAARVLMMISGHSGMDSVYEHCGEDYEMDGNMSCPVEKSEKELDYSGHRQTRDAELTPESDVKLKFISLSNVLKATATHDCKLCGKVFTSSQGLASHKKFHKVHYRKKVAASPNSAMPETGNQLLEVDCQLLCLNLPGLNDRNYSRGNPKSELTPWWTKRGFRCDRMLGVV